MFKKYYSFDDDEGEKKPSWFVNLACRGRKRKTTTEADKLIQQKIKVDGRKSSSFIKHEIMNELKIAICRCAHELRLYEHVAREKPHLYKVNRVKLLNFAQMSENKRMTFWKNVLWSDESKYNQPL